MIQLHYMKRIFLLLCISTKLFAQNSFVPLYQEPWRPQFHFTPPIHWTNDPNGLVYYKGEYHLFYQYNPMGIRWGHMSWGHAMSRDLLHWQHLPLAIEEGKEVMIFSGTCVVDEQNTSGLGKDGKLPMVAIYTGHQEGVNQSQHLAYSLDQGRTWTKYDKNPILDLGKRDFRDPKVFWYAPHKKWVMAVVLPIEKQIQFYSSPDLKSWSLMSSFGPAGDVTGIWECPDLFEVPVAGQPGQTKWVLMHSPSPLMQYFVGSFDGNRFTADNPVDKVYRPDYGPDYYAAIVYNHLPKNTGPFSIGWVNNWNYANDIPVSPWRGAFSIPRKLSLVKEGKDWILQQEPIPALNSLREPLLELKGSTPVNGNKLLPVAGTTIELQVKWKINGTKNAGIILAQSKDKGFKVGYNAEKGLLYLDRSAFGNTVPNQNFAALSYWETPYTPQGDSISLRVFIDRSIVEVYADNGRRVMTAQIFPGPAQKGISLFSEGAATAFEDLRVYTLKTAWK